MAKRLVKNFLYEKESYEIRGACFDVYKTFRGALPFITKQDIDQFWKYLKGSDYKLGFLINFSPTKLEIKRIVYDTARYSA